MSTLCFNNECSKSCSVVELLNRDVFFVTKWHIFCCWCHCTLLLIVSFCCQCCFHVVSSGIFVFGLRVGVFAHGHAPANGVVSICCTRIFYKRCMRVCPVLLAGQQYTWCFTALCDGYCTHSPLISLLCLLFPTHAAAYVLLLLLLL